MNQKWGERRKKGRKLCGNFTNITFNCIRNIFPIQMYSNQPANVIFHLPLVIDNIFEFNFWAAMIVRTSTAYNNYASTVRFECTLFSSIKYSKQIKNEIWTKRWQMIKCFIANVNAATTKKQKQNEFISNNHRKYIHFFEGYVVFGCNHFRCIHHLFANIFVEMGQSE